MRVAATSFIHAAPTGTASAMDGTGRFLALGAGTVRCGSFLTATPEQKLYDKTSLVSDTSVRNRASGDT